MSRNSSGRRSTPQSRGRYWEGGEAETGESGAKAELGLTHVPSVETHGGIRADGGIRRDAVLNLSPLRALGSESDNPEDNARAETLHPGSVPGRVHSAGRDCLARRMRACSGGGQAGGVEGRSA